MVEAEANFMLALIDLSSGYDINESRQRLKDCWIKLAEYEDYKDCLLLKTGEIAKRIVDKHPEWGAIQKAYK